jgi:TP901 family phage tail tape measure protein
LAEDLIAKYIFQAEGINAVKAQAAQLGGYLQAEGQKGGAAFSQSFKSTLSPASLMGTAGTLAAGAVVAAPLAFVAAAGAATNASIKWEAEMANVQKTAGAATDVAALGDSLLQLSTIPGMPAKEDLASIAEMAGSLGVDGTQNVETFTEAVAHATSAFGGLTAGETATQLAKMENVFGIDVSQTENLASAIDWVGNNLAATEAETMAAMQKMSGLGAMYGMTASEAAGLSGSLVALGMDADSAGTLMSSLMTKATDTAQWGKMGELVGMTAEEFGQLATTDVDESILQIAEALEAIADPMERAQAISDLGLGIQESKPLLKMVGHTEEIRANMEGAGKAFEEGTGAMTTFNAKAETSSALITAIGHQVGVIAVGFGSSIRDSETFHGVLEGVYGTLDKVITNMDTIKGLAGHLASDLKSGLSWLYEASPLDEIVGAAGAADEKWNIGERIWGGIKEYAGTAGEESGEEFIGETENAISDGEPDLTDTTTEVMEAAGEEAGKAGGKKQAEYHAKAFLDGLKGYESTFAAGRSLITGELLTSEATRTRDEEKLFQANRSKERPWTIYFKPEIVDVGTKSGGATDWDIIGEMISGGGRGRAISTTVTSVNELAERFEKAYGSSELAAAGIIYIMEQSTAGGRALELFRETQQDSYDQWKQDNAELVASIDPASDAFAEFTRQLELDWEETEFQNWVETLPVDLQVIDDFSKDTQKALYDIYEGMEIPESIEREGGIGKRIVELSEIGDEDSQKILDNINTAWDAVLSGLEEDSMDQDQFNVLDGYLDYLITEGADPDRIEELRTEFRTTLSETLLKELFTEEIPVSFAAMIKSGLTDFNEIFEDIGSQAVSAFNNGLSAEEAHSIADMYDELSRTDREKFEEMGGDDMLAWWRGAQELLDARNLAASVGSDTSQLDAELDAYFATYDGHVTVTAEVNAFGGPIAQGPLDEDGNPITLASLLFGTDADRRREIEREDLWFNNEVRPLLEDHIDTMLADATSGYKEDYAVAKANAELLYDLQDEYGQKYLTLRQNQLITALRQGEIGIMAFNEQWDKLNAKQEESKKKVDELSDKYGNLAKTTAEAGDDCCEAMSAFGKAQEASSDMFFGSYIGPKENYVPWLAETGEYDKRISVGFDFPDDIDQQVAEYLASNPVDADVTLSASDESISSGLSGIAEKLKSFTKDSALSIAATFAPPTEEEISDVITPLEEADATIIPGADLNQDDLYNIVTEINTTETAIPVGINATQFWNEYMSIVTRISSWKVYIPVDVSVVANIPALASQIKAEILAGLQS